MSKRKPERTLYLMWAPERQEEFMDKQQIDQIRQMVIHGLYSVTLKNGYRPDVFAAFKAEQNRLFDNYEANAAKIDCRQQKEDA